VKQSWNYLPGITLTLIIAQAKYLCQFYGSRVEVMPDVIMVNRIIKALSGCIVSYKLGVIDDKFNIK